MDEKTIARFWAKVDKSAGADGCWPWTGYRNRWGYGQIGSMRFGERRAHRWAWVLAGRDIPPGMFVCHHCDNPPCVNPAHLFVGGPHENNADRAAKGRTTGGARRGTSNHNSKINEAAVRSIRALHVAGTPRKSIAARFGVSVSLIHAIIRNDVWTHV